MTLVKAHAAARHLGGAVSYELADYRAEAHRLITEARAEADRLVRESHLDAYDADLAYLRGRLPHIKCA